MISRVMHRIASWHLGTRIDGFVNLFGATMARSNGVMLEHATVRCREEHRQLRLRD